MTNTKACINPAHDHDYPVDERANGTCACTLPSHYDEGTNNYHHDDPDAPMLCYGMGEPHDMEGKTPCQMP